MSNKLFSDRSLINNPTAEDILIARAEAGAFAASDTEDSDYVTHLQNNGVANQIAGMHADHAAQQARYNEAIIQIENDQRAKAQSALADAKRMALEEAARLKSLAQYRKSDLVKNADGSLHTDGALELRVKQGVNGLIGLWNSANDFIPDALVKDDTLDIGWAPTATIRGMAHEDLRNKDVNQIINNTYTKKDVLAEASAMKDDPTGQGTLYYGRKNIGTTENPEYIYKPGFATLNFADRYREQARASGWEIVREVQSSGSAELEKKIQTAFIDDRLLSAGQVKGKDGKYQNHDKASGIDFGSGYSEIYSKDILGWDKKPTKGELNKFKVGALKQASKDGVTGDQLRAYRARLDAITPDQLHQMNLDNNKARSYAKRDERDVYRSDHYNDGAYSAAAAGLNRVGRELMDAGLDAIAVEGMDQNSALGAYLQSDGKGNSERLDKWKSQEEADKYTHYDRKKADEFGNALAYDINKGDYFSAVGQVFTQGGLNMTAESLGYQAPMLVGAILGTALTGGSGAVAGAVGYGSKIKTALGMATEAKAAMNTAQVVSRTAEAAAHAEKITAANAIINSGARSLASKAESLGNILKHGGFSAQVAAQSNERIDARIANNGGQPTSMLENLGVVAEGTIELLIDRAVDLATLGMGGYKDVQNVYKLLDNAAKANIATKIAAKAVALTGSAGMEGATEYVQYWGQALSEQYDTKKNAGTIAGIFSSKENQEEAFTNLLMGAAAGVHMQAVPTGIKTVVDAGKGLAYRYGGGKTRDEQLARAEAMSNDIENGTFRPENHPVSIRGDKSSTAVNDAYERITGSTYIPAHIAASAIEQTFADGVSENAEGIVTKDAVTLITNVDKSLRAMYQVDDTGVAATPELQAKYEHTAYQHALESIKQVVAMKDSSNKELLQRGFVVDDHATSAALDNVISAYKAVLPANIMNQVMLMTANTIMRDLQSNSIENADSNVALGDTISSNKDGSYSVDVVKLEETVRKLNSIVMGSSPASGSKGPTGVAFDGSSVLESISKMKSFVEESVKNAKEENGKVKLSGDFFDQAKSAKIVGSEILLEGKTDNESGPRFGKGIYQHAEDVIKSIATANTADGTTTKVGEEAINSWLSFALNRVKINSVAGLDKSGAYTKSDIWKTQKSDEKYEANYIPEYDRNGDLAKQKIQESDHMINAANQVKTALEMSTRISPESKASMLSSVEKVIAKSEQDKIDLQEWVAKIESGHNSDMVLSDLRGSVKYFQKKVDAGTATAYDKKNLAEAQKKLADAIANGGGRFNENTPVYVFEKNLSALKKKNAEAKSYSEADVDNNNEPKQPTTKETDNGQDSTLDGDREPERATQEDSQSTEDSEDDQPRAQGYKQEDVRAEETGRVVSDVDELLSEASRQLEALHDVAVSEVSRIASIAGIKFPYQDNLTLSENLKELRKSITPIVNLYKKSVQVELKSMFDKTEKLAVLLTAAIKGLSIDEVEAKTGSVNPKYFEIVQEEKIQKAKVINDAKSEATVAHNPVLKESAVRSKNISRLKDDIEATRSSITEAEKNGETASAKSMNIVLKKKVERLNKLLGTKIESNNKSNIKKTELEENLLSEQMDVKSMADLLGIKVTTGVIHTTDIETFVKAQHEILSVIKTDSVDLKAIQAAIDKIVLPTDFDSNNDERVSRAIAKQEARMSKAGITSADAYVALQLAEELNEVLEVLYKKDNEKKNILSIQKAAQKIIRFGKDTVIKDGDGNATIHTNKTRFDVLAESFSDDLDVSSTENTIATMIKLNEMLSYNEEAAVYTEEESHDDFSDHEEPLGNQIDESANVENEIKTALDPKFNIFAISEGSGIASELTEKHSAVKAKEAELQAKFDIMLEVKLVEVEAKIAKMSDKKYQNLSEKSILALAKKEVENEMEKC